MMAMLLFAMQGLSLMILLVAQSPVFVLLFVAAFGPAYGSVTLARPALIADFYGTAQYGRISSVMAMATTWALTVAPVGVSLLHDHFGSYQPVLWVLMGIFMAAVVVVSFVRPR
jgi:MFS family permease